MVDTAAKLFDTPTPRLFTIPPATGFLTTLAETLAVALDLKSDPSALATSVIYTPNRRAARALAEAFHETAISFGHGALISPDIRVLGDLQDDDAIAPIGISELELGPPLPAAKRRGKLAKMVQAWKTQLDEPLPPSSALSAADELSILLDQTAMGENVDWSRIEDLAMEADLAAHWQVSADFLSIITKAWPGFLEEEGATDPMARRVAAAEALANLWKQDRPEHPIVIAGSTGATPATRILMHAAMHLPRGMVILPGLDPDIPGNAREAIKDSPSHPQYTLVRALDRLEAEKVAPWPGSHEDELAQARRKLVNEALAPASATKDWTHRLQQLSGEGTPKDLVHYGMNGLSLIETEDEAEEALAAALMLREALETPGRTAALITPDPALARRVSALLKRWNIDASPSAGSPFLQCPQGSLIGLMFKWLEDPADPVYLLALLKHPLCRLGLGDDDKSEAIRDLERHPSNPRDEHPIRGPRKHRDLSDLADRLESYGRSNAAKLILELDAGLSAAGILITSDVLDGAALCQATARLAEFLTRTDKTEGERIMWRGREGAEAAKYLETLHELATELGPMQADLWADFALNTATSISLPPRNGEHPRISIWGPLEARLQTRDLIILASLNEGMWPAPAPADSFLSRRLRRDLGLPDPEERIGLSAHDFAQLACQKEVVLLRAKRVEDKPSVASRWIWRLRTLASGALSSADIDGLKAADELLSPKRDQNPLVWAQALREVESYAPTNPPEPKPPLDARPKRFSVSRITRLIRDPYSVYAGDILRLQPMKPPGIEVGPAERGTAIHTAVERFDKQGEAGDLLAIICEELAKAGMPETEIALARPLWSRAADAYLQWRAKRRKRVQDSWLEEEGQLNLEIGETYSITGKADRIELMTDGTLAIIDFKTGAPKTKKQVESGLEPQLVLEAAIAEQGGYKGVPAKPTSEIIYVSLAPGVSSVSAKNGKPVDVDPMEEAHKALEGFRQLVTAYSQLGQPYRSKPRVEFTWAVSDYDRLARRAEWTADDGSEE